MNRALRLIDDMARLERDLLEQRFVAPCARGGLVQVRVGGLVHSFRPEPRTFEGWALFAPTSPTQARVAEWPLTPSMVDMYRALFPRVRLVLMRAVRGRTWSAVLGNASDAQQRLGFFKPVQVHLVEDGAMFETIVARWDGASFWFERVERRADPRRAVALRRALADGVDPERLRVRGSTPEERLAYTRIVERDAGLRSAMEERRSEGPLRRALRRAGGAFRGQVDRGDAWLVEFIGPSGKQHRAVVGKDDLTVYSAGVCLDGYDRDFDLTSLVRVVEDAPDWSLEEIE